MQRCRGEFPQIPMVEMPDMIRGALDSCALLWSIAAFCVIGWASGNATFRRNPQDTRVTSSGAQALVFRGRIWAAARHLSIAIAVLFLCDQHRLQPWAYQGWIIMLIVGWGAGRAKMKPGEERSAKCQGATMWAGSPVRLSPWQWFLLRAFAISVYLYSASGKFDAQFFHTVGPQMINVPMRWGFLSIRNLPQTVVFALVSLLPAIELGLGLLLIF
ncbi:MAG: hypothetical protein AAFN70_07980, partial [Planctomycetota bacterium]